jgi:hypothetical protein
VYPSLRGILTRSFAAAQARYSYADDLHDCDTNTSDDDDWDKVYEIAALQGNSHAQLVTVRVDEVRVMSTSWTGRIRRPRRSGRTRVRPERQDCGVLDQQCESRAEGR